MFFRFGAALLLVVLISLSGTALEKRNLELKRVVSRQSYRLEILQEQHAAKRVLAQQTGQSFVVDNKPGATQMIGARIAANAKPDGKRSFSAA